MPELRLHSLLVQHLADAGLDLAQISKDTGWNAVLRQLNETYVARDEASRDLEAARTEALRAHETEQGRAQFIANLGHELRTPLNAILGYSELLVEELNELRALTLVDDVRRVERAGRHLLGLVNDVLDLAKFDAGRLELANTRFAFATVIADSAELARPLFMDNQNRFVANVPADLGSVTADPTRLRQCVNHVLSYSAKNNQNSEIRLTARRQAGELVVDIVDDGPGLTAEQRAVVFEDNAKADAATTRQYGGAGLGLALTRRFLERMGGSLRLETAPGRGTRFTLTLPDRDWVAPDRAPKRPEKVGRRATDGDPVVLLIDDDPDMHEIVRRMLDREGIEVVSALDGETGIRLARDIHPRAILLDLLMPGLSGWEVLTRLKSEAELAHTPVVVVSGIDERSRGLMLGADAYLVKPVDRQALLEAVRRRISGPDTDVLLVDDDFATRRLLRTFLQHAGLPVRTAANGQEALDRVREQCPGIIVLDLVMPVMDGPTFLRHLRSEAIYDEVSVVVTTPKDLSTTERGALDASVDQVRAHHGVSVEEILQQVAEIATR